MTTDSNEQQGPERLFIHAGAQVETKACGCGKTVEYIRADLARSRSVVDAPADEWLPIEHAPKRDTHWLVVAKIADTEPNKGAVLWWYRAMFWRGAWRTSPSYSCGTIKPTHFCDPEQFAAATTSSPAAQPPEHFGAMEIRRVPSPAAASEGERE